MSQVKRSIYALSIISGTIIGVGLFSLPYITLKVGILPILGYFFVLGILVIIVHYLFAEVSIKTPDFVRFPGFAKIHLGNWGKNIALASNILGLLGAILAYLIVGGEFLTDLLGPVFGGQNLLYTLFYFVIGAALIYFGIKAIAKVEFWGLVLFFIILIFIFFKGFPLIQIKNLFPTPNLFYLFLPYGPILFSLWGAALIPEAEEILKENKKLLRKIIPISILIPIFVYLFFIFLILGICGGDTTQTALTGLKDFLGSGPFYLLLFFGLLTTFTSFITLGLTLKKIFWYDLKLEKKLSWFFTCFIPLILFLIGIKSFIVVISAVGGIMLGVDGILIILMYKKINPQKKALVYPLIFIFALGILYEIIYFLK